VITKIKSPDKLLRRQCDWVGFSVIEDRKGALAKWSGRLSSAASKDYPCAACYADITYKDTQLPGLRIKCYPPNSDTHTSSGNVIGFDGKSQLPEDYFLRWMDLCRQHHLLPKFVGYYRDGKRNVMELESLDKFNRLQFYSALCAYRLADYCPDIIWRILHLLDENSNVSFWQSLQHSLSMPPYMGGHGFMFVEAASYSSSHEKADLSKGLALARILYRFRKRRSLDNQRDVLTNLRSERSYLGGLNVKDILDPKWRPLYSMLNASFHNVQSVFKELKGGSGTS
jgi:hypothetical protein